MNKSFPKKNTSLHFILPIVGVFLISFSSCQKKENDETKLTGVNYGARIIYVLNEGLYNMNNSSITRLDCTTGKITADAFKEANNRGLGDTGSDFQRYGNKLYCVVNVSERLEILDINSCKSIKTIAFPGKQPRHIVFADGQAFVSCYDGDIVRIDTVSMEITGTVKSGLNPDGLCIANGKLYVANSGGLNWEHGYDNTVSVISPNDLTVLKKIEVVCNPTILAADDQGDIYLISAGNYADVAPTVQRISSQADTVIQKFDFQASYGSVIGNFGYFYSYDWTTGQTIFTLLDLVTEQPTTKKIITDGTKIDTPYGLSVNPANSDLLVCDAHTSTVTGDVFCFDKNGKLRYSFETGFNPSKIVIIY